MTTTPDPVGERSATRFGGDGEGPERTVWPFYDGDLAHALRYAHVADCSWPTKEDRLYLASVLSAYAYLTDPSRTQKDALDSLKRARRVRLGDPIHG